MMKWILGTVLGVILGIAGYFFWYLGGWKTVHIEEKKMGPYYLVYKDHIGAYHKIAPVITEVETFLKSRGHTCLQTFGEFFDDPREIEEGRLKSRAGCIFKDKRQIQAIEDYRFDEIPEKDYVVAVFDGSPGIGPIKVYPKVQKYFESIRARISGSVIEIYEVHSQTAMTTTYLFGK